MAENKVMQSCFIAICVQYVCKTLAGENAGSFMLTHAPVAANQDKITRWLSELGTVTVGLTVHSGHI